jgi:ATP-binding cassette, subfamily B, bacterial
MFSSAKILSSKLRKALAQLPYLPRALKLVWAVARRWTTAWIALLIMQGLLPAATVYLTKLVVDGVVVALRNGNSRPVLWPLLLLGVVLLLMEVVRNAINWVRTVQAELLQDHITSLIHEKSVSVDLAFYELSDYYDHLHRARAEARYRPVALLGNLGALLQNSITLVAMGAILIPLGPWLALALLLSTLPAFYVVVHYALAEYQWRQRTTADDRRAWYYDLVMTTAEAAAEIRLFGLGQHFQSLHKALRTRLRNERLHLTRRQGFAELAASLIALVIMGSALGLMVMKASRGLVTLGELALIYAAFNQGQGLMRTLLENAGQLYGNSLFLGNLFEFLSLGNNCRGGPPWPPVRDIRRSIIFDNVSFTYPDATSNALDNFNMTIPRGKIVAIVGPNGAGKSTLLKLLCRFYDPDSGSIAIDGKDLKDFPVDDLRRLITVLFQQPFHYNSTVRDNILYGDLKLDATDAEIKAALRAAGAEQIVSRLPRQEQTLLGRWFAGGTELSVGEWQRIALARAFLRQSPIIILDEPTSALDPWAEADWLERFRELAFGRTSIIITHRFTTAMHADMIHVMDRGRIVESGTHQRLLDQNGLYAQSWSRQTLSNAYAKSV